MQLTRDASLVIGTRTVRSFSDGFVSVLLASYLSRLGFSGVRIGLITTATLLGTAAATIAAGAIADRFGRRRLLILAAVVAAGTGFAFASSSAFVPILFIALIGTLNPSFSDVSMFLPIEQAILPETVEPRERTALFARYNLLAVLAAASGALFAGVPSLL